MDITIGRRIGVEIRMIGAISMMQPRIRRMRFTSSAMTTGLFETPVIRFAARSGTWSLVRQ